MVFPAGIKSEDSDWSKTLIDAYHAFDQYALDALVNKCQALHKMSHFAISEQKEKFFRRWKTDGQEFSFSWLKNRSIIGYQESGWQVEVGRFKQYIKNEIEGYQKNYNLNIKNGNIKKVSLTSNAEIEIELDDLSTISAKQSFWGVSYGAKNIQWIGSEFDALNYYLQKSRKVAGAYISWNHCPAEIKEDMALDLNGDHLIFRPELNLTMMGSTTQDHLFMPDLLFLNAIYERWQHWQRKNALFTLPCLDAARVHVGMRFRGAKKRPWIGSLGTDEKCDLHVGLIGTYKNGYSLPFHLVPAMADKLKLSFLGGHC